jgi:hypothetical protein
VALALSAGAATPIVIKEDFSTDPTGRWSIHGDPALFQWNEAGQHLEVTWDSSKPKSFFYVPLGRTISRDDHFSFEFDLRLDDIVSGHEPGKNGPMQIGIGFLNVEATNVNWSRTEWPLSANVAEFNSYPSGYYPGWPVAPTTAPAFVSGSGYQYAPTYLDEYMMELPAGQVVRVAMHYDAFTQTLTSSWRTNGVPVGPTHKLSLEDPVLSQFKREDNFNVNIFSISSYKSNEGPYADSVLAHGVVDNISIVIPPAPPVTRLQGGFVEGRWQMLFRSRADWTYALERTRDFSSWEVLVENMGGTGGDLILTDQAEPTGNAFYRVRANQ